ncbi:MAG: SH3 domain-containing protein [Candidatus Omnitrophica bacterium]|nr:SH3 domain-containing protein [Candidatus Omnitrophota bacterium]
MRRTIIFLILFFIIGHAQNAAAQPYLSAPTTLPNIRAEMKTPGFWISRLNAPDEVVMTPEEIQKFNQDIITSKLRDEIAAFPENYSGKELRDILKKRLNEIAAAGHFTQDGRKAKKEFFDIIEKNLDLEKIPDILTVKFAFVVRNADQRFLPTKEILTAKTLDIDFDELQNSALDINTPVAVLWQSADRRWSYTIGPSSSGWVLTENLALCSQDDIKKIHTSDFAVVTEAKADIYLDKERKQFYGFVRMGTRFEIKNFSADVVEIALPLRDENGILKMASGHVQTKNITRGYRPYTRRTIIEQAFEMLNTPYGWGGANGEQDCSQFLQEVFATVGVDIPRDSSSQAKTGISLYDFNDKESEQIRAETVLTKAQAGVSLLYMQGHILLYLGSDGEIPYAIHDTWAYREKINGKDTPIVINKVTVSDLSLGHNSNKGSLLKRLKSIRMLGLKK